MIKAGQDPREEIIQPLSWLQRCKAAVAQPRSLIFWVPACCALIFASIVGGSAGLGKMMDMFHGQSSPSISTASALSNASTLTDSHKQAGVDSNTSTPTQPTVTKATPTEPLKQVASTQVSNPKPCQLAAKTAALTTYNVGVTAETARHQAQISLLQTTGNITSLLGADMSAQIAVENVRHDTALTSLYQTYETALAQADCL